MDPREPATPISYPLTSLEDLANRSYFSSFHFPFNESSVPLPTSWTPLSDKKRPRILVCHDMKGGYQDDKWVQGGSNPNAYSLWHWHLLDIFVYFSHSLVSLPPPCWTNAAHKHGVQVLGTFITEWDEGATICKTLLATKQSSQMYASRLAELAVVLGFDGWLINIENKIKLEYISNLKEFVHHLTATMHLLVPGSTVIWYDSVTEKGKLQYQNCLNEKNKCFFDLCDGIFTNYSWKENYPQKSADFAGERRYDVYMGVDVFGRNTFGGGGFHTNVALKVAREADVSAAIFAPGWVYETGQGPTFQLAQNRYWGLISDCWPSAQHFPFELPLFSNFDQGYGEGIYANGKTISRLPWNNISCQSLQPLLHSILTPFDGYLQVNVSYQDFAFDGGCCIKFFGEFADPSFSITTLYNGTAAINSSSLFINYSVAADANSKICLIFKVTNPHFSRAICLVDSLDSYDQQQTRGSSIVFIMPTITFPQTTGQNDWIIREYKIDTEEGTLQSIYAINFLHKLDVSSILDALGKGDTNFVKKTISYAVPETGKVLSSSRTPYQALLGHLRINYPENHDCFQPLSLQAQKVHWVKMEGGKMALSMMLTWHVEGIENSKISKSYIYVEQVEETKVAITEQGPEYLGVAVIEAFYVSKLFINQNCKSIHFYLQRFCSCGIYQDLKDAPQLAVKVPSAGIAGIGESKI